MHRDAELRAASYDESDNTIEVVWTTGATGRRVTWMEGEFDEELVVDQRSVRLDRLNAGAPFLDTHQRWGLDAVIGSVVPGSARLEAGLGLCRVMLSKAEGAVDRVARIIEGTVKNVSVGSEARSHPSADGRRVMHRAPPREVSIRLVEGQKLKSGDVLRRHEDDQWFSISSFNPDGVGTVLALVTPSAPLEL
jgi:hypothetical protein